MRLGASSICACREAVIADPFPPPTICVCWPLTLQAKKRQAATSRSSGKRDSASLVRDRNWHRR